MQHFLRICIQSDTESGEFIKLMPIEMLLVGIMADMYTKVWPNSTFDESLRNQKLKLICVFLRILMGGRDFKSQNR